MDSIVKAKLSAILIALLFGVGLLAFFYRKIKNHFRFRLKHLKELGIFYEKRKRFTESGTKAIREKVISSTIGIHQEKNGSSGFCVGKNRSFSTSIV